MHFADPDCSFRKLVIFKIIQCPESCIASGNGSIGPYPCTGKTKIACPVIFRINEIKLFVFIHLLLIIQSSSTFIGIPTTYTTPFPVAGDRCIPPVISNTGISGGGGSVNGLRRGEAAG